MVGIQMPVITTESMLLWICYPHFARKSWTQETSSLWLLIITSCSCIPLPLPHPTLWNVNKSCRTQKVHSLAGFQLVSLVGTGKVSMCEHVYVYDAYLISCACESHWLQEGCVVGGGFLWPRCSGKHNTECKYVLYLAMPVWSTKGNLQKPCTSRISRQEARTFFV